MINTFLERFDANVFVVTIFQEVELGTNDAVIAYNCIL